MPPPNGLPCAVAMAGKSNIGEKRLEELKKECVASSKGSASSRCCCTHRHTASGSASRRC
ncbi:hypothetical protein HaLaN_02676 [Haematococcus lacustris]|uniref:Uncharacterized protein n=1 Tax=Haematococcus lacustris TaxID=44745 RepID=A0A699YLM3_HAELA|nr:hypothetical protein HaLaN_02676 [Haematococcus lacustris]